MPLSILPISAVIKLSPAGVRTMRNDAVANEVYIGDMQINAHTLTQR